VSASLIAIVTLIYLGVAASEFMDGNPGMSVVFGSYAMANVGLIMVILK
jgi:hypothetical protein